MIHGMQFSVQGDRLEPRKSQTKALRKSIFILIHMHGYLHATHDNI